MALYLKNDAIFLHIPKTGGSFVSRILYDQGLVSYQIGGKHSDASHILVPPLGSKRPNRRPKEWLKYALAVRRLRRNPSPVLVHAVRNPYSWYESWFKYMSAPDRAWRDWGTTGQPLDYHPNMELNGIRGDDFNAMMADMIEKQPAYVTRLYCRFGSFGNTRVLKLETIAQDLCDLLDDIGAEYDRDKVLEEPPYWVSKKAPIEWDPKLRARIAELDRAAFEIYGYTP
ncbi:hypothetical protein [Citreimonas sp.]|uniref:hypothetical protein n=1 Tax=Citreimonas sp. TaxID=3036715 RepID=UPI0035C7E233